jgi:RNA polymerase sigma factor (TIGR02999 family)
MRGIYPELRAVAERLTKRETTSLQVTELVSETYLRIAELERIEWKDRRHFLAMAARSIRRVLVDRARRNRRLKRGGELYRVELDEIVASVTSGLDVDLLTIHQALERLEAIEPVAAKLVELRYFGGLSIDEAAPALGLGRTSAVELWQFARAWLRWAVAGPGRDREGEGLHLAPLEPAGVGGDGGR